VTTYKQIQCDVCLLSWPGGSNFSDWYTLTLCNYGSGNGEEFDVCHQCLPRNGLESGYDKSKFLNRVFARREGRTPPSEGRG